MSSTQNRQIDSNNLSGPYRSQLAELDLTTQRMLKKVKSTMVDAHCLMSYCTMINKYRKELANEIEGIKETNGDSTISDSKSDSTDKNKLYRKKTRDRMELQDDTRKKAKKISRETRNTMPLLQGVKSALKHSSDHLTKGCKIVVCDDQDGKNETVKVRRNMNITPNCRHRACIKRNRLMRRRRGKAIFFAMLKKYQVKNTNENASDEDDDEDDDDLDDDIENMDEMDMGGMVLLFLKSKKKLAKLQKGFKRAIALAPFALKTVMNSEEKIWEEGKKICENYFERISFLFRGVRQVEEKKLELVQTKHQRDHICSRLQIFREIFANEVEVAEPETVSQELEVRIENNNAKKNEKKCKKRRIDVDADCENKKKKCICQPHKPILYNAVTAQPRENLASKAVVKNVGKPNKSNKYKKDNNVNAEEKG